MTELHLNTNVLDDTGFREYIVYDIYNKMGIEIQNYNLGRLQIGEKNVGIITIIEVINDEYVFKRYNSKNGNLYKPETSKQDDQYGAELQYRGDSIDLYEGIFSNTKTKVTSIDDKERLVSIIKNLSTAKTTEEIEKIFYDFDKVIKMVAINKAVSNVDGFTGRAMRNYYIYEEDGKIDILPFDFNMSLGMMPREYVWREKDVNTVELIEYNEELHSKIVDIIVENEEYSKKYSQYLQETLDTMEKMPIEETIDRIDVAVEDIVKNTENLIFSYEEYKQGVVNLKEFIKNRINSDEKNF